MLNLRTFSACKISLVLTLCVGLMGGCDKNPRPGMIGPQFWKYDLSEYKPIDQNVLSGMGGRWISMRYELKDGQTIPRDQIISRITQALEADGWNKEPLPERYVLSTIWETSPQDLCFTRRAREPEPEYWFFSQVIHVSQDGRILCIYYEVGW